MKGTDLPAWYQTQVVAGTPPDIVDIQGGLWLQYASQGGLLDLTPYLKKDKDYTDRMYPEVLHNWVYQGKNYGAPLYISKTLLFLNRIMMKKAGIDQGSDELRRDDGRRQEDDRRENSSGFITLNFDWLYWPLFKMNGIDFVTPDLKKAAFNTPEAVKLVEQLAKLTKEGRDRQGQLDRPLGRAERRLRGRQCRHAARACAGLSVVQEQGRLGEQGHGRRHQPAGRMVDAELARARHLGRHRSIPRRRGTS